MKHLLHSLFLSILLGCVLFSYTQPFSLYIDFKDYRPPGDWWSISTDVAVAWKIGKLPPSRNPLQNQYLYVYNPKNPFEDLAIMTSGAYQLPKTKSLWLSLEIDCQLNKTSLFRIDLWDGQDWNSVYFSHQTFKEKLKFDISHYPRKGFKLKFVYKSKGFVEEYIGVDNLYISANKPQTRFVAQIEQISMQVFPNPFQSKLNVTYQGSTEGLVSYWISDLMGKKLYHNTQEAYIGKNEFELSLGKLPKGLYMLSLATNGGVYVHQLIKR